MHSIFIKWTTKIDRACDSNYGNVPPQPLAMHSPALKQNPQQHLQNKYDCLQSLIPYKTSDWTNSKFSEDSFHTEVSSAVTRTMSMVRTDEVSK